MNQYWNMLQRYTAIESILGKKIISHALDCTGHKMWLILLKIGQNCPKKNRNPPERFEESLYFGSWETRNLGLSCEVRHTHAALIYPLPLSHCPDLSQSPAKKNTQKTQFSRHSPIFRINPSRRHFQHKRKFCVTPCDVDLQKLLLLSDPAGWNCHSTALLRSNSIFIVNVIFRHHPKINTLLWGTFKCWTVNIFCSKQPFYMDSKGIWGSSLWWPPLCVLQLEGWGKLSLDIRGVAWWGEELSD